MTWCPWSLEIPLKEHLDPSNLPEFRCTQSYKARGASVSDVVPVVVEKPPFLPPSILCKVFWILLNKRSRAILRAKRSKSRRFEVDFNPLNPLKLCKTS